ncbi:LmeA family phospholipid-binding protein [Nocardia farcinica]
MRKLIIGLLCLAGVAVLVDFAAAAYSEYRVSRTLREGADLSADPEVTIHGFPFLAQALDGRYQSVVIRAAVKRPDIPGEISVDATLTGVQLSLSELNDGGGRRVPVERVEAAMRIEPTELGRLFNIPDLQVHSRPADKSDGTGGSGGSGMTTEGALVLTGALPGTGTQPGKAAGQGGEKVAVDAELVLDGDQIRITATELHRSSDSDLSTTAVVPEAEQPAVLARFTRTIDTKDLPFGVHPTKVIALGGQIVVDGRGDNVTIDLDQLQRP